MAVVIETTLGDITVDLYLDQRPVTCLNFLKLCKMKYYNFNLFHSIRSGFIAQTGDPTGEGSGGNSIFGILEGPEKRFFSGEKLPKLRHTDAGLLSMVCTGDMMVGSQFFFTLGPDLDSLDGVHCVIGEVTEGHDVLRKLNDIICDETHRPYRDVRITHTVILEDPFNDPPGFRPPSRSPSPNLERLKGGRIAADEEIDETQGKSAAEIQELIEEKEAKARATILEIVGDLPDADIAPPENVLFVCKLNPVTTDEDLEIIFSRFGNIVGCEVIRDKRTGNSLQYAFIEFADKKSCEDAYFKMDNVLIDDRRIHVDFSQSVSKMRWLGKGKGIQHFDDEKSKNSHINSEKLKSSRSRDREYNNYRDHHSNIEDKNGKKCDNREHRNRTDKRDYEGKKVSDKVTKVDKEKCENRKERRRSNSTLKLESHNNDLSRYQNDHYKNNSRHSDRDSYNRYNNARKHENDKNRDISPRSKEKRNSNIEERSSKSIDLHKKEKPQKESYRKTEQRSEKNRNKTRDYKGKQDKSYENHMEPRTPTPPKRESKRSKLKNNSTNNVKKDAKTKTKIKKKSVSESSDSDSSSTTSSDSSSSSDGKRKKVSSRKKKRYSSSSSSSSSDSSSSTSSSSSSDSSSSTSSSSDSEPSRKKKKHSKKNVVKKSRKLL